VTEAVRTISGGSTTILLNFGAAVSLGIIGIWVVVAFVIGRSYHNLVKNNKIIE
jgi:hypothetical protein